MQAKVVVTMSGGKVTKVSGISADTEESRLVGKDLETVMKVMRLYDLITSEPDDSGTQLVFTREISIYE